MYTETHIETQKITAHIPVDLLHNARAVTGMGITETIKEGLKRIELSQAYENIRKLRGKVKFTIDLNDSRKDRDEK